MIKTLKIFWQLMRINFKKALIYRKEFWITLNALIMWTAVYIAFFEVLFLHIDVVAGWNKGEMLVVLGFYYLGMSIGNIFYRDNFEAFNQKMLQGKIDHVLTKPANGKLLIFFENMRFDYLTYIPVSALIFAYAFVEAGTSISPTLLLGGFMAAFIGQMLFYGMLLMLASIIFYVDRLESMGSFVWHLAQISRYPRQVFVGIGRVLFQFIFPLALIGSVPAEIVLGMASLKLVLGFTLASVIVCFLGSFCFDLGLRRYHSAN